MQITINNTPIALSDEYAEYIDLMRVAVVKPGEPPVESAVEMVKRILLDNYAANIQQHAAVRPKSVAEKIKAIESQALSTFQEAVEKCVC
tara:strand:+ start:170 stop:439 length:270 start_codon:yes stop_codon:yes gene_type:complete